MGVYLSNSKFHKPVYMLSAFENSCLIVKTMPKGITLWIPLPSLLCVQYINHL